MSKEPEMATVVMDVSLADARGGCKPGGSHTTDFDSAERLVASGQAHWPEGKAPKRRGPAPREAKQDPGVAAAMA